MARQEVGWIRLHRKIEDSDIARNFTLMGLWSTLLRWANYRESRVEWRGLPRELKRGEVLTSETELAEYGGIDRKTVHRWILYLSKRGSISVEKSPKGSRLGMIVTVLNYEKYNNADASGPHEPGHEPPHERDMSTGTYKERKKERRKENIYAFSEQFEQLAKKYRELFKGTTTGHALPRFKAQMKNETSIAELDLSMQHYRRVLDANDWRKPKQTFASFLGTETSGFFWREYITMPELPEKPGGTSINDLDLGA